MAELLPQPGGQKDRAAQHQQPDDHHPRRLGHINLKMAGHRRNDQGNGHTGQLHQQLRGGQANQGFPPLPVGAQLLEIADDIEPDQD